MPLGAWHMATQRRLHALFSDNNLYFWDFHYGEQRKLDAGLKNIKHFPDFLVRFKDKNLNNSYIAIELKSISRLMDNRNAIQLRYFVKRFDGFILLTEQPQYEPLSVWMTLEGLNHKIRWIYERNILSEVANYAKNDNSFRWFYDRYADK